MVGYLTNHISSSLFQTRCGDYYHMFNTFKQPKLPLIIQSLERMSIKLNSGFFRELSEAIQNIRETIVEKYGDMNTHTINTNDEILLKELHKLCNNRLSPVILKYLGVDMNVKIDKTHQINAGMWYINTDTLRWCIPNNPNMYFRENFSFIKAVTALNTIDNIIDIETARNLSKVTGFKFELTVTLGLLFIDWLDPQCEEISNWDSDCIASIVLHEMGHCYYSIEKFIQIHSCSTISDGVIENLKYAKLSTLKDAIDVLTKLSETSKRMRLLINTVWKDNVSKSIENNADFVANQITLLLNKCKIEKGVDLENVELLCKTYTTIITNIYSFGYTVMNINTLGIDITNRFVFGLSDQYVTHNNNLEMERYADEFATKTGAGKFLTKALSTTYTYNESFVKVKTVHSVNPIISTGITLINYIIGISKNFSSSPSVLNNFSIYDPNIKRLQLILSNMYECVNKGIDDISLRNTLIEDIKEARVILNSYSSKQYVKNRENFWNTVNYISQTIMGTIAPTSKLTYDYRTLQDLTRALMKNELGYQATRIKLLIDNNSKKGIE